MATSSARWALILARSMATTIMTPSRIPRKLRPVCQGCLPIKRHVLRHSNLVGRIEALPGQVTLALLYHTVFQTEDAVGTARNFEAVGYQQHRVGALRQGVTKQ